VAFNSYDERLRLETARRNEGILRMRSGSHSAGAAMRREVEGLRGFMSGGGGTQKLVQEHPWTAVFSAFGVGLVLAPLARMFARAFARRPRIINPASKRMVVEVVDAQKKPAEGAWRTIMETALQALTAVALQYRAVADASTHHGNGHSHPDASEPPQYSAEEMAARVNRSDTPPPMPQ
jgi:hypothetical protein